MLTVAGIFALQVFYGFAVFLLAGSDMATRGQFGDLFGGLNAFFTGLAFAGVIYTILLQQQELQLQRDELVATREELACSSEAQREQVSQLKNAADLSAMTALLNVYISELQPLRETTRNDRSLLASNEAYLRTSGADMSPRERKELFDEIGRIRYRIGEQEAAWAPVLEKHDALVSRLEALVEQVSQDR